LLDDDNDGSEDEEEEEMGQTSVSPENGNQGIFW